MSLSTYKQAQAHAKILLFGEHSALYGYAAIGCPLPAYCSLWLSESNESASYSSIFQFSDQALLENLHARMHIYSKSQGIDLEEFPSSLKLCITSTIAPSGGYGSSAALCVSFSRLYLSSNAEYATVDLAWFLEHLFHTKSSGIDIQLSAANTPGIIRIQNEYGNRIPAYFTPVRFAPLWIVHAGVQRSQSTSFLISQLAQRLLEQERSCRASLDALGAISEECIQNATSINPEHLGFLAMQAQKTLTNLGLNEPSQDLIIKFCNNLGSPGGKLSGAGGGGAFFIIACSEEHGNMLCDEITQFATKHGIILASPPALLKL